MDGWARSRGAKLDQIQLEYVADVSKIDATIPGSIFKKVHFLPYLHKAIKKCLFLLSD